MLRLILCLGDQPETGGHIEPLKVPFPFTIMSHPAAYIGQTAFCNACKSSGVIAKSGGPYRSTHGGREVALDRDVLRCQCPSPPPIIARMQSISRIEDRLGSGDVMAASNMRFSANSYDAGQYDEKIVVTGLADMTKSYPYFIETSDGRTFQGRLDSSGHLPRIYTDTASEYVVYWGDEALAKQDGA